LQLINFSSRFFSVPNLSQNIKSYVYSQLFLPSGEKIWQSQARHASSSIETAQADVLWNEKFHWEYIEDDITFLRWVFIYPAGNLDI